MKRHVQYPGVRKWSGDDLLELQSESLSVADRYFSQYGNCIIAGCKVSEGSISEGLVCLGGMVLPFAAVDDIEVFPVYLVKDEEHFQREYADDVVRDIAVRHYAKAVQTKPGNGDYIEITSSGASAFIDKIDASWLAAIKAGMKNLSDEDKKLRQAITAISLSIVPTLDATPSEDTLTYTIDKIKYDFYIGQQCRVYEESKEDYVFYQLYDISENGKADWRIVGSGASAFIETVKIILRSDQGAGDNGLIGKKVTIKYGIDEQIELVWNGVTLEAEIPMSVEYEVIPDNIAGYLSPEAQKHFAIGGNEREIVFEYEKILDSAIVFDSSISDPENISGEINSGTIAMILAKFRRCLCKKTAEGQVTISYLRDDNSNFYEDGTPAKLDGTEGDVMVDFPEFYYKWEKVDANRFRYRFSLYNMDGTFKHVPRSLVGAYKAYMMSDKLYSRSGVPPTNNKSFNGFTNYATARGAGYQIIDFQQHCVIAFMLYARYGNRNLQAVLGTGGATYNPPTTTGSSDSRGIADTVNEISKYVCGLGVEGVFGGIYEWVKGVRNIENVWEITDPDGTVRNVQAIERDAGYITKVAAEEGPFFDMVPTAVGGSDTTHYADYCYSSSGGPFVLARSFVGSSPYGGVAFADANHDPSYAYSYYGSRLAFRGEIREAESVSAFKALSVL